MLLALRMLEITTQQLVRLDLQQFMYHANIWAPAAATTVTATAAAGKRPPHNCR